MSAIELMAKLGANPSMRDNLSDMELEKLYAFERDLMANHMMSGAQHQISPDDGDDEDDQLSPV